MHFTRRLLNNELFGRPLSLKGSYVHQQTPRQPATIYLKRVKWVTGRAQLENHFNKFGQIKAVDMFFDPITGLHRGFASITFASPESKEQALRQKTHIIDDSEVSVVGQLPMDDQKHQIFSTDHVQAGQKNQKKQEQTKGGQEAGQAKKFPGQRS